MTLTATEELDPEYKDAICVGELKQALNFFAGGLSDFTMVSGVTMCLDFTLVSDFTFGSDFTMVSDFTPPSA